MGLDMYLIGYKGNHRKEIGYWRKSNQIHRWFVEHVQKGKDDCEEYIITTRHVHELITTCQQVLEDRSRAPELLPTQSGFFFGATDYDEMYFNDIIYTVRLLEKILTNAESFDKITYQSSW